MQNHKSKFNNKLDRSSIIVINNVTKYFRLPHERVTSLKESASRLFRSSGYENFFALDRISFQVDKGEFLGIIGPNGSGKSTLLKLLAGIYLADTGRIRISGSISPFLELGVGFNPELTARENIFLYGIVLGMKRKEIEVAYPRIISFSGLHRFVDTKLKNFSSGMQVRLAFSVAIQAVADIYLIDEVLAVGDIEFQKKCFQVFRDFKNQGKTVIFVSHDLASIKLFCDRTLWLDEGGIVDSGQTSQVIKKYSGS